MADPISPPVEGNNPPAPPIGGEGDGTTPPINPNPPEPNPGEGGQTEPGHEGSVFNELFPEFKGETPPEPRPNEPKEPKPQDPPNPGEKPSENNPPQDPNSNKPSLNENEGWDIEKFISDKIEDPKKFLDSEDKITQFSTLRDSLTKALTDNKALTLQLSQQSKVKNDGETGTGVVLPETDAVKTLQSQLAERDQKLKTYEAGEAKEKLSSNPAFMAQFDKTRSDIYNSLTQIAEKSQTDKSILDTALKQESKYDFEKYVNDNVTDATAAEMIKRDGAKFLELSNQKQNALNASDPITELKKWQDYEVGYNNALVGQMESNAQMLYESAYNGIMPELLQDAYFNTDAGKQTLLEIQTRIQNKQAFEPREVVKAMATADSVEVHKALNQRLIQEKAVLEKELASYKKLEDPTAGRTVGGNPTPAPKDTDFLPSSGAPQPFQIES